MANVKITELTAATALAGTDVLPIVDVGADATKKVSVSDLLRNLPDGTASAPALAFADDQNSGILSPANNELAFATSGTQRFVIDSSGRLLIGTTTSRAASNQNNRLQLFGTSQSTARMAIFRSSNDNGGSGIHLCKSRGTAGDVVVNDGDQVGILAFNAYDGGDFQRQCASIQAVIDATPGVDDVPGRLVFSTTANGGSAPSERMRINNGGRVLIGTTSVLENTSAARLQIAHTSGALLALGRNDSAVSDGNHMGKIAFYGNDGGAYEKVAQILCEADGSHASGDKPGRLVFQTTADNASSPTERMRINSSGNVGIGATSPAELLHVSATSPAILIEATDTSTGESKLQLGKTGNTNVGEIKYSHSNNSLSFRVNDGEKARIDSSGRLLVGTSSSLAGGNNSIQLVDNGAVRTIMGRDDSTVSASVLIGAVEWYGNGGDGATWEKVASIEVESDGSHATGDKPGRLVFSTTADGASSPTERMRIDSSGNVGIGTTAPSRKLHVASSFIRVDDGYGLDSSGSTEKVVLDNGFISLTTNSSERMRIDSSGKLGIGTSSVNQPLHLAKSGGSTIFELQRTDSNTTGTVGAISFTASDNHSVAAINAAGDGDNEGAHLIFRTTSAASANSYFTSTTERMRIASSGTVSIGSSIIGDSSNGQGILFTDGGFIRLGNSTGSGSSTMAEFKTGASSTQVLRFQCDGDIENQNNRYSGISDVNLKENIVDAGSQWDDIKNIRVRKYNFREDTGLQTNTQIGVIAQEVELISPGLVKDAYDVAEDGSNLETTRKSVSYSVLYMKAVKALQEAMDRIETLETKVAALEAQ